jgi:FixJ family two-component response regulator
MFATAERARGLTSASQPSGKSTDVRIDQSIPADNGLHSIMQLRARRFSAPAILVISQPSPSLRKEAEKAGVPIVEKPLLGNGLLDTIRDATRGRLG